MMLGPDDFAGDWDLDRTITDHRHGGMDGVLRGRAVFAGQGGLLRYTETGHLQLTNGPMMEATRAYQWVFGKGRVAVQFADGGDFHSFVPTGKGAGTTHLCGADLYDVTYDFAAWPVWTAVWSVRGPRKDYTSVSCYRPA